MLSNSLINGSGCMMSDRRPSSPSQKKLPNASSSSNSSHKLKKLSSTSLCTASKAEGTSDHPKSDSSHHSRIQSRSDNECNSRNSVITGRQMTRIVNRDKPWFNSSRSHEKLPSCGDETDGDLLGVLSRQLYLAENQMQRMQSVLKKAEDRLKAKDQEIGRLKQKVREWEAKNKNQDLIHKKELQHQKTQVENSEYLYKRCLSLEHKIFEMEKFLADYGLVWVGNNKADANKRSDVMSNDYIKSCYAQLTANIEELNMSVGKGEVQVQRSQDGGGASFKTPSCMCLRFYKNGMVMNKGKLRPYSDPSTGSFIRDILDGYFPSELQESYPNGVPFKVEDHRTETFLGKGFPGHGYRLGKQSMGTRPSTAKIIKSTANSATQSPRSSPNFNEQRKQYNHKFKAGMFSVPASARSSRQTICSQASSADLHGLRSQILASHNNNCSDTHLQSHMNAELGISNREKKRVVATKSTEYRIAVRERAACSRDMRAQSAIVSNRSRTNRDGSVDRLALGSSPSRLGVASSSSSRIKSRPRSASLNYAHYPPRVASRTSFFSRNNSPIRDFYNSPMGNRMTKPRISRSAMLDRKKECPTVREINMPTGNPGEFRVKVRSMSGSTVFLVHVSAEDTVGTLYQLLDRTLLKGRTRNYKIIISGYERQRLDQFEISLNEYGITRDSVLHLVND